MSATKSREEPISLANWLQYAGGLCLAAILFLGPSKHSPGYISDYGAAVLATSAAFLFCLGGMLYRNSAMKLFAAGVIVTGLFGTWLSYSHAREVLAQDLALALAQSGGRDKALQLITDHPWLAYRDLPLIQKIKPDGTTAFGGDSGHFPIEYACSHDDLEMLKLILVYGPANTVELSAKPLGLLYSASNAENNSQAMVEALLSAGADPNHPQALYCVVKKDRDDLLKTFFEHGLRRNFNVKVAEGGGDESPLALARKWKSVECLKLLEQG